MLPCFYTFWYFHPYISFNFYTVFHWIFIMKPRPHEPHPFLLLRALEPHLSMKHVDKWKMVSDNKGSSRCIPCE